MRLTCTNKFRNMNGKIMYYEVKDEHNSYYTVTPQDLKNKLRQPGVTCTNLKLTSNGRLISSGSSNMFSKLNLEEHVSGDALAIALTKALRQNIKINSSGYKTRAGVVTSARFLTLQFKNRISYFYENGRLVNYGDQDYADGEGRYYHEGLYLTENKFKTIKASVNGPAAWGCPLYVDLFEREEKNGLDCSGFVSWALLNGGFDVGDVGAGIDPERTDDLDDLGEKMKVNESDFDPSKIKVGDLFSRYGHIGILIGKDNDTFYIAEALDYDLHVLTMTSKEILESEWLYVILMDDLYKKDGNLKEMW